MIEIVVPFGPDVSLRVSGATSQEVLADLTAVEHSQIPLTLGRVIDKATSQEALGRILGAEQIEEHHKPIEGQDVPQRVAQAVAEAPVPPAPAPAQQELPPGVQIVPGAPIVMGQPAWLMTIDEGWAKRAAFVHPSTTIDWGLPRTSNPDDPRLATGEAMFYMEVG